MIGREYHRDSYNCSHVVADYYRDRLGVTIPSGAPESWGLSFIRWMRKTHRRIPKAEQDCLILVRQRNGELHVGVWDNNLMLHGFSDPSSGGGQVIRSPLVLIRGEISFWRYHGNC